MSETTSCRWDREAERHLTREHLADCKGNTCAGCRLCTHDDDGNPVRHCRVRNRCTSHLGWDDYACPRCLNKIRANLTGVLEALAVMPHEAEERGIDSEPANLAGPHADYVTAQWRLINADRGGQSVEELDMRDPYTCLTFLEREVREHLGHAEHTLVSADIEGSARYLEWVLTDLARDEAAATVLLPTMLGHTSRLLAHLQAALRDSRAPERGAPCRSCVTPAPRLRLERAHYCEDEDCHREHLLDDSGDLWVCPVDRSHWWTLAEYRRWVYADARELPRESA